MTTNAIKAWEKKVHNDIWQSKTDCRQSRLVLPNVEHDWSKYILSHDKNDIRLLTQLTTGHANLKYHRFMMNIEDNPDCDFCGERQTAIHIITECPSIVGYRLATLGRPIVKVEDIRKYKIDRILKLARNTEYWDY